MKNFKTGILLLTFLIGLTVPILAKNPIVQIKTTKGDIFVELYQDKAPITVENFLGYVNDDFYDGTIFHRVIKNFMIQTGGFEKNMITKKTRNPIANEAHNLVLNEKGTIAMARTSVVDSATSQFFINLETNPHLDHRNKTAYGYGYAVFGKVIKGLEVVEAIGNVGTTVSGVYRDVPIKEIVIKDVEVLREAALTPVEDETVKQTDSDEKAEFIPTENIEGNSTQDSAAEETQTKSESASVKE